MGKKNKGNQGGGGGGGMTPEQMEAMFAKWTESQKPNVYDQPRPQPQNPYRTNYVNRSFGNTQYW